MKISFTRPLSVFSAGLYSTAPKPIILLLLFVLLTSAVNEIKAHKAVLKALTGAIAQLASPQEPIRANNLVTSNTFSREPITIEHLSFLNHLRQTTLSREFQAIQELEAALARDLESLRQNVAPRNYQGFLADQTTKVVGDFLKQLAPAVLDNNSDQIAVLMRVIEKDVRFFQWYIKW